MGWLITIRTYFFFAVLVNMRTLHILSLSFFFSNVKSWYNLIMAIVEIESVRSKFEPGDSPKGSDYLDLIDTLAALPDISGKQDVVANVSSTEIGYLDGVTSAIQTQINTKAPTASPTFTGTVTIPSGSAITGVPYLATANTFTGGVQQITTASAATVGLIVKASASQTANLQEWQDSAGTALINVTSAGFINIGRSTTLGSSAITVQNAPAFTQYSTNNAAINVIAANFLRGNTVGNAMYIGQLGDAANGVAAISFLNTSTTQVFSIGQTGSLVSTLSNAASTGLIVKGAASQTANLQEWQNSAGTALGYMGAAGQLKGVTVSAGSDNLGAAFSAFTNGAGNKGIIVRATAPQTANLQEWQNSAGSVVANITASGGAAANYYNSTGGQFLLTYSQSGGNLRLLKSTATANVPGADTGVLYFRDGTTAGTLKLVVRAGASGAETTILDNIPQS